jgi:hypothetical protein
MKKSFLVYSLVPRCLLSLKWRRPKLAALTHPKIQPLSSPSSGLLEGS